MENKKYDAFLLNENGTDFLCLRIIDDKLKIDLNSEDQTTLREIFVKIIKRLFVEDFEFIFKTESYEKKLFLDIAKDYIDKLNAEIKKIIPEIPEELKVNVSDDLNMEK